MFCLGRPYKTVAPTVEALIASLVHGPVVASMDTSSGDFEHYGDGVFVVPNPDGNSDHAIAIVGHGIKDGIPYAIIK